MKTQIKLLIALTVVTLILGGLALASARYGTDKIVQAIDAIGEVSYSEESKALIDAADQAIADTDANLHLAEKSGKADVLQAAKVTYVERAIVRLYRAVRDKADEATIIEYLSDAQAAFDAYFTESDSGLIHNYQDLLDAQAKYGESLSPAPSDAAPTQNNEAAPIDVC